MKQEISDYDKYNYDYQDYWENPEVSRNYENALEHNIAKKLLPKQGNWFCDIGSGFGRLFDSYKDNFENIILVDYSTNNLKKAKENIKKEGVFFVAANVYNLPFKKEVFDAALSVRLLHHLEDPKQFFFGISNIVVPRGYFVLEYANKKHFIEKIRYFIGKSKINPFKLEPEKRGEDLFYNFHPKFIKNILKNHSFKITKIISSSNFRSQALKKILGTKILLALENAFRFILSPIKFGPSIFVLAQKSPKEIMPEIKTKDLHDLLICPKCSSEELIFLKTEVRCKGCGKYYSIIDGVYDLRV